MKRLAIALYFDQSPAQHEDVFRSIVEKSYIPLLKLIKEKKLRVSIFVSLSQLEQLEKFGYTDWIRTLKELIEEEKVELLGGSAYSYLLPAYNSQTIEQQIILNEYAQAYYFGKKGGFEGDPSLMIRDLKGFFPPKLALNTTVLQVLEELGYEWSLADQNVLSETSETNFHGIVRIKDSNVPLIIENNTLKNVVIGKTDPDITALIDLISKSTDSLISFDAQHFGHVFDQGILLLEKMFMELKKLGTELVSVSDFISEIDEKPIKSLLESDISKYQSSDYQRSLWEVIYGIISLYVDKYQDLIGFEELPIWNEKELSLINDVEKIKQIKTSLLINKVGHIDNFTAGNVSKDNLKKLMLEVQEILDDSSLTELIKKLLASQDLNSQ